MSIETEVNALTQAVNALIQRVDEKMDDIEGRMSTAEGQFQSWMAGFQGLRANQENTFTAPQGVPDPQRNGHAMPIRQKWDSRVYGPPSFWFDGTHQDLLVCPEHPSVVMTWAPRNTGGWPTEVTARMQYLGNATPSWQGYWGGKVRLDVNNVSQEPTTDLRTPDWVPNSGILFRVPVTPGVHNTFFVAVGCGMTRPMSLWVCNPAGQPQKKIMGNDGDRYWVEGSAGYYGVTPQIPPLHTFVKEDSLFTWAGFVIPKAMVDAYTDAAGDVRLMLVCGRGRGSTVTTLTLGGWAMVPNPRGLLWVSSWSVYAGMNGVDAEHTWYGYSSSYGSTGLLQANTDTSNNFATLPVLDTTRDLLVTIWAHDYWANACNALTMSVGNDGRMFQPSPLLCGRAGQAALLGGKLTPASFLIPKDLVLAQLQGPANQAKVENTIRLRVTNWGNQWNCLYAGFALEPWEE